MPRSSGKALAQMNSSIRLRHRVQTEISSCIYDEPSANLYPQLPTRRILNRRNNFQTVYEINKNETAEKVMLDECTDFVTANCQILTIPTDKEVEIFNYPDGDFPWDRVFGVRCFQTEVSKCPICLEELTAPRMGKCGHIYCLPCIKYCIGDGGDFRKCAICFKMIEVGDLRRVYIVPSVLPNIGDKVKFSLMRRGKESIFPQVVQGIDKRARFLSRYDCLDRREELRQIEEEIHALESYAESYEAYGCLEQANLAKMSIHKLKKEGKKVQWEMENASPSYFTLGTDSRNPYVYYQMIDGTDVYLHGVNWKCLLEDYGEADLPLEISGKVVEIDAYTMNSSLRRRYAFLKHLPIGRTFSFVEIELENPVIREETLNKFSEDFARRLQMRLSRQELELELDIEKQLAENSYAPGSRLVGFAKLQGASFTANDFVPLEVAASSSLLMSSPPHRMSAFPSTSMGNFEKLEPPSAETSVKGAWFKRSSSPVNVESEFPPLEALTASLPDVTSGNQRKPHRQSNRRSKRSRNYHRKPNPPDNDEETHV